MDAQTNHSESREYDFALVVGGVETLTRQVEDALFCAGCDDATVSLRQGRLYLAFSREADSLQDAILSAIREIHNAGIGARVLRVDGSELVTASEIARRSGRSRQAVFQYINHQRGPGGFPAPESHLAEGAPLWAWCDVSQWLAQHNMVDPMGSQEAQVVAVINNLLQAARLRSSGPEIVEDIARRFPT